MPQPTILQVIPALDTGGAEQTAIDLGRALVERGWVSMVASSGGRMLDTLRKTGSEHIDMPLNTKNPYAIWRNAARLESLITERKVDLIHARSRAPAWSCLMASRRQKIPFVTTYHGAYNQQNFLKGIYNSVMVRSDRVIANSMWTAELIRSRHPSAANRIVPISRGTDMEHFSQQAIAKTRIENLKSNWGLKETTVTILHLARLTGWKGQRVIIEAAAKIKSEFPHCVFVLAGDSQGRGAYLAELQQLISAHALEESVLLPGHCDDPAAAMAAADIVVVASTEPEAFGRAAVEASALAKPVIVTKLGAVEETVLSDTDSTRTGWKVRPGDAEALAQALREVLSLPAGERDTIGQRGREYVETRFSLHNMCERTIELYREMLRP